jgi:hypothetical protein
MVAHLLDSQPIPFYTGVPPFPSLVFVVYPRVALFLFASISVVSSLIELPLLQACPSNHGMPIEVNLPILFPHHNTYDHDDSTIIPVRALAPAHLISYCANPRTHSLAWCIDIGPCQSLFPYVIHCLLFVVYTFPWSFLAIIIVDMNLLSYPLLLYNLILHCNWWSSVGQSYPACVLHAFRQALCFPPRCDLPCLSCHNDLLSLFGCSLF